MPRLTFPCPGCEADAELLDGPWAHARRYQCASCGEFRTVEFPHNHVDVKLERFENDDLEHETRIDERGVWRTYVGGEISIEQPLEPNPGIDIAHWPSDEEVAERAASLLGLPYRMRARGPTHYDCFGLCLELWRRCGIELPDPFAWPHDHNNLRLFYQTFDPVPKRGLRPLDLLLAPTVRPPHAVPVTVGGYMLDTGEGLCSCQWQITDWHLLPVCAAYRIRRRST